MSMQKDLDDGKKSLIDDWALSLMTRGVVVKLKISRWRGYAPLTYEELGWTSSHDETVDFMKKYITLGSERLLPPRVNAELSIIEKKARTNLENFSFNTIWGKFVPYSAFSEWEKENNIIKQEYLEAANQMGLRYDDIISTIKENYKKMANEVWNKIYPVDAGKPSVSFIEGFTGKIIAKIPPMEDIVTSFKYDHLVFSIPLPSFLHQELLKAEKIKNEKEIESITNENKKQMLAIEMQTKQRISEEYREKKSVMIDEFLDSTTKALRISVAELCQNIMISINRTEKCNITKAHTDKIKKFVDHIKLLNFQEDHEVEKLLSNLNEEVSKFKGEREKDVIVSYLQKLIDLSKKEFVPDINPIVDCADNVDLSS